MKGREFGDKGSVAQVILEVQFGFGFTVMPITAPRMLDSKHAALYLPGLHHSIRLHQSLNIVSSKAIIKGKDIQNESKILQIIFLRIDDTSSVARLCKEYLQLSRKGENNFKTRRRPKNHRVSSSENSKNKKLRSGMWWLTPLIPAFRLAWST